MTTPRNITFNFRLFRELPTLLNVNRSDIGEAIGLSRAFHFDSCKLNNLMMRHLVSLCNHYHIDVRHFFIEPGDPVIPSPLQLDTWHPITFTPTRIKTIYKPKRTALSTAKQLASTLSVHAHTLRSWSDTDDNCPMMVHDVATLLSAYDLDADFITDNKNPLPITYRLHRQEKENRKLQAMLSVTIQAI